MKFSGLAVLALATLTIPAAHADTVHLGVGGHEYGETTLGIGQVDEFGFTLSNDTHITSLDFEIYPVTPDLGGPTYGTYSVFLTGPLGETYWYQFVNEGVSSSIPIPTFLPAGSYDVTYEGLACTGPCVTFYGGSAIASIPYFVSESAFGTPTFFQDGGTVTFTHLGWNLTGYTTTSPVPEPASLALLGTGLAGLLALGRHRFRTAA